MQNRLTTVTRWTLSSGTSQDYKFLCLLIYLIQKSILNTLLLYSPTITLVWIPIWASFLWLIDDSYLKLEVKYWNNTRCLADLKNGTKLGCEKAEIILMAQSDRETEIFRLLPKYDSIPTTSSPGVTFHILNSWYNEDPNQSKWLWANSGVPMRCSNVLSFLMLLPFSYPIAGVQCNLDLLVKSHYSKLSLNCPESLWHLILFGTSRLLTRTLNVY